MPAPSSSCCSSTLLTAVRECGRSPSEAADCLARHRVQVQPAPGLCECRLSGDTTPYYVAPTQTVATNEVVYGAALFGGPSRIVRH